MSDFHLYPLGARTVCLDTVRDRVHLANPVAATLWRLHREGVGTAAIVDDVCARYAVDRDTARLDVERVLAALEADDARDAEVAGAGDGRQAPAAIDALPATGAPRAPPRDAPELEVFLPGAAVTLRSGSAEVGRRFGRFFALSPDRAGPVRRFLIDVHAAGGRFEIVHGGRVRAVAGSAADAAVACLREVDELIARAAPRTAIFHAAALALGGRAVLLPARSGSGKSTLCAWLVAHGFELLNDDVVPLTDGTPRLVPMPVALSIKAGSWPVLAGAWPELAGLEVYGPPERPMKHLPPRDGQVRREPVACSWVVLPERDPALRAVEIASVPADELFEYLVASDCLVDRPLRPRTLAALTAWVASVPCVRMRYPDLDGARSVLMELLGRGVVAEPASGIPVRASTT